MHIASPRVLGVVGNPRPQSRTLTVVDKVVAAFAAAHNGHADGSIDLIALKNDLFTFGAPSIQAALEQVMQADILVFGSPVYKASYTGVLKAFCDHISAMQLAGKRAIPLMVGGSLQHYLALDTHLRPLLVELGARCATPGLYVVETELDQLDDQLAAYVASVSL
jgi:FMN reductase